MPIVSTAAPNLLTYPFAYVVCYDLKNDLGAYALLAEELQKSIKWMHYLPNVWFILRYEPLGALAMLLRSKVYAIDKLLVMPAVGPTGGLMPMDAWEWLNENLPKWW
jgi:hypothetical protein